MPDSNVTAESPSAHNSEMFMLLPADVIACVVAQMPTDTMKAFARTCRAASQAVASETHWHLRFKVRANDRALCAKNCALGGEWQQFV